MSHYEASVCHVMFSGKLYLYSVNSRTQPGGNDDLQPRITMKYCVLSTL